MSALEDLYRGKYLCTFMMNLFIMNLYLLHPSCMHFPFVVGSSSILFLEQASGSLTHRAQVFSPPFDNHVENKINRGAVDLGHPINRL